MLALLVTSTQLVLGVPNEVDEVDTGGLRARGELNMVFLGRTTGFEQILVKHIVHRFAQTFKHRT